MANQISARLERAVSLLVLTFVAAFAASTAQALPQPTAASFARGVQFEVAGYTNANGTARSESLSGFPVLVRIANDSPSGFAYSQLQSQSDGADLCFIDMDGNGLPFEIDTWNTSGTSLIWVTLPTMEQGTQFVMCWGGATSGKTVCGTNPFAGYKGVWHMNSVKPSDSSPNSFDGTNRTDNLTVVAGPIGDAVNVPRTSTSDGITCGNVIPNSELVGGYTIEGWCRPTQYGGMGDGAAMFGKGGFASFRIKDATKVVLTTPGKTNHEMSLASGVLPAVSNWWHFAATFKLNTGSNGFIFYLNGQSVKTMGASDATNKTSATELFLGNNQWNQAFKGDLDEIRLSADLKSADWIAASYATQSSPTFLTAGEAQTYEETAAPDVGLSAPPSAVLYTNATLTVSVGSLGMNDTMTTDADWVDPLLVVSENADLSDPLFVLPLSRVSATPASIPVTLVPLATNTTYYAQLRATNSFDVAGESGVVSFTTRMPGAPSGSAIFMDRGFSTMAATATVTSFGAGGESANVRLEASTDDFETVVAGEELPTVLDASTQLSVTNLATDTMYSLRIRVRNDWGLETYLPLPDAYTRAVPFASTGIGWTFSQNGSMIDIAFGISVYDGATGTATLTYDGVEVGSQSVTGPGQLSWPGITAASGTATATVVLSATLNSQPYTQTFTVKIAPGSTAVPVSDIAEHMTAATSVRVHTGDVVTLPELSGTDSYIVGNKLFASLDGNVLTALRPGILGVHCVTESGTTTNTLAVIVLPEKIGDGDIYIYDETAASGNGLWTRAAQWETVGSETRDSYPHNTNDIAIIPFYSTASKSINIGETIFVGSIFFGGFRDAAASSGLGSNDSKFKRNIVFARTDGEPALVQCCSSSTAKDRRATLSFNGMIYVDYTVDTVMSGGWDGAGEFMTQGRVEFNGGTTNTIPEGITLTFVEFDTQGTDNSRTFEMGLLVGAGTLWNRSAANIKIGGDNGLAKFTGLLRDSSRGNTGTGRSGPIFVRTPSATNTLYELAGFVARNSAGRPEISSAGVGRFYTGWEPGYGSTYYGETNWFPACGLVMHGGSHYARATENKTWGVGGRERKVGARLTVADGFNYLYESQRTQKDGHPINWLEYNALNHENKATLLVRDPTRDAAPEAEYTNVVTILHGWTSAAVGPAGNPVLSETYPIVPWIVSPLDSGNTKFFFASFDSTDRLVRPAVAANNTPLSDFSAGCNAYCRNGGIALTEDLTVNSLYLQNDAKAKTLGVGRTLTVTSGGLILSDVDDKNNTGAAAIGEEGGSENGALVLGDADHPAYVWACGATTSSANTAPNQIWAPVTAPGGFVAAYTGNLVLGGDQTGIRDEIAVNAGTLQLGTAESTCSLATELPIRIFANATLKLPNDSSATGNIVKFDGAAGWFGKVEVPAGVAAKCRRVYWRDYPETQEWQVLKRGIYGSSESGAPNIRDDLFVGAGTLQVLRDDSAMPFFIMVR